LGRGCGTTTSGSTHPHRNCRDRLSGQRPILLLIEHGHCSLRAFTIDESVHDDLGVAADDFPLKAAGIDCGL
jgi:hypothetical protein